MNSNMDSKVKTLLVTGRNRLLDDLDMTYIVDHLVQETIISLDQRADIMAEKTRRKQVERFLSMVESLPQKDRVFESLCHTLRLTGYSSLEAILQTILTETPDGEKKTTPSKTYRMQETFLDEIPKPVSYFFNRQSILPQLTKDLEDNSFLILKGIRGCGKTQIARYLAHEMSAKSGVKMEIYCKSADSFLEGVEFLINSLNFSLPSRSSKHMPTLIHNMVRLTMEHLEEVTMVTSNRHHVLVFDDVTSGTVCYLLDKLLVSLKGQLKVIITTSDGNLYPNLGTVIEGFTKKEALDFFKQDFQDCQEDDQTILDLGEKLSFLPLGLAVAKQFIRKRHQTIKGYLKQLTSNATSFKIQEREASIFSEREYDKGLIRALQMSIAEVKANVSADTFAAYEITSFLSHMRFPLDYLRLMLKGSNEEKELEIDDLIESITQCSVGTVHNDKFRNRLLHTHKAVQMVLRLGWTDQQEQENLGKCLVFLSQICNKDTRFENAFQQQLTILPHVEETLSHAHDYLASALDIQTAEIRLLEALGHMYSELIVLDKSEQCMLRAMAKFLDYFLINQKSDIMASFQNSPDESAMVALAENILENLTRISQNYCPGDFLDLVLMRMHPEHDIEMWASKIKEINPSEQVLCARNQQITRNQYEKLLKYNIALPAKTIQNILLPELFVTILYTYGLIYFHRKSRGELVPVERMDKMHFAINLSHQICKAVKRRSDINLMHLMLTDYHGTTYNLIDETHKSKADIISDITEAKLHYENVLYDQCIYFQSGLLKKYPNERYNVATSLRQQLICTEKLIRHSEDVSALVSTGKAVRDQLEQAIRNHSYYKVAVRRTEFYNTLANFSLLLGTLGDADEINKAIKLYTESISVEETSESKLRSPWLPALVGLSHSCLIKNCGEDMEFARNKLEHFLDKLPGKDSVFAYEWQQANMLLGKINCALRGQSDPSLNGQSTDL